MTITQAELGEIRVRAEAATEGPWEYIGFGVIGNADCEVVECRGKTAEFIAAARQDVPKLLAEVSRLQGEVERLTGESELLWALLYRVLDDEDCSLSTREIVGAVTLDGE